MMSNRHYRPIAVPLMTQVVALPGQWACRGGAVVSVDGNRVAIAKSHDRMGRPLPRWQGCHRVRTDELFMMNPAPDSLDGRYFGALPAAGLIEIGSESCRDRGCQDGKISVVDMISKKTSLQQIREHRHLMR